MTTDFVDPRHPHEPEVAPIFDPEGRCLVCGCQWRDEQIERLTAERDRYRQALDALDSLDPRRFRKSFFDSMSGGPETDFYAAFREVCRIVNRCLHNADENGRPRAGQGDADA